MLETKRLTLRKILLSDAPFIKQLVNTEGWLEFIGDREVTDIETAQSFIQTWALERYEKYNYGPYLVSLKDEPIGVNGLFKRDFLTHPDLGFAFLPRYMGEGYAAESSKAIIDYACDMCFEKLGAITMTTNSSSKNLLIKLGFSERPHPNSIEDLYFELALK